MNQITDKNLQWRYAETMFRFKSIEPLSKLDVMQSAKAILTSGLWSFVVNEYQTIPTQYAELYKKKYGEWHHQAGRTREHNDLGMRWAGRIVSKGGTVELDDSPDIYAKLKNIKIIGDVGQCSFYPAAIFNLRCMQKGDLWISVFENKEIILEAQTDIFTHLSFDAL